MFYNVLSRSLDPSVPIKIRNIFGNTDSSNRKKQLALSAMDVAVKNCSSVMTPGCWEKPALLYNSGW